MLHRLGIEVSERTAEIYTNKLREKIKNQKQPVENDPDRDLLAEELRKRQHRYEHELSDDDESSSNSESDSSDDGTESDYDCEEEESSSEVQAALPPPKKTRKHMKRLHQKRMPEKPKQRMKRSTQRRIPEAEKRKRSCRQRRVPETEKPKRRPQSAQGRRRPMTARPRRSQNQARPSTSRAWTPHRPASFRTSDPVALYQKFRDGWKHDTFLNSKSTRRASEAVHNRCCAKASWR